MERWRAKLKESEEKKQGTRGGDERQESKQERKRCELQRGQDEAEWTEKKTATKEVNVFVRAKNENEGVRTLLCFLIRTAERFYCPQPHSVQPRV